MIHFFHHFLTSFFYPSSSETGGLSVFSMEGYEEEKTPYVNLGLVVYLLYKHFDQLESSD